MKKRGIGLVLLLAVICIAAAGCGTKKEKAEEKKGYTVYQLNEAGTGIAEVNYVPEQEATEDTDKLISSLLEAFETDGENSISAMPAGNEINGVKLTGDVLAVDFGEQIYECKGVEAALFKAALVKTLVQVPGVNRVQLTVDGKLYVNDDGSVMASMDGSEFIDSRGEGINAYQYSTLNLYFPDESGEKLVKEVRNVYYSTNIIPERVVLEQLLAGPKNTKLQAVAGSSVRILNIQIQDKLCIIDLDKEFNTKPDGSCVKADTAIYAIVNSVCDSCQVTKVLFKIDGKEDAMFRDELVLDQVYAWNPDMLATQESEASTEPGSIKSGEGIAVGIDPALEGE